MLTKQNSSSLPRKLALRTFGELPIVISIKVNLLYLLHSAAKRCCLLHLIKQNYLLKTFLRILILITQVSLLLFSNISVTPKIIKKVRTNLDLSKASGRDCIPMVVLKSCEHDLPYILAELFTKCLKESGFPDCLKVSSVVPIFKNVRERSTAKNYRPVSLLSVVGKVFEKLLNRIVHLLEKCDLFSDFQ